MFIPRQFREDRPEVLARAVRAIQFAALVTPGVDGSQVSHLPMALKQAEDGGWTLESHVARANPHWALAGGGAESVAVFQGPHAYVSPSWHPSKREHGKVVPTWNYIAVHAHGRLEAVEDRDWLLAHVRDLTDANEAGRARPWAVADAPAAFIEGLARAIVGLRLPVARVEGAWKMAQHKGDGDRLGMISGLEAEPGGRAVAEVMRGLEAGRVRA